MSEIEVLSPIAATRNAEYPLAPRPPQLDGRRLGLLDNCKANAADLLAGVRERLGAEGEVIVCRKDATAAAPDEVMAHLARCDAVILAIADWGSCTSWSVHDAIALERNGVASALLCTDEFGPLARAEAEVLGMAGLPLIALPHPLAGNAAELVGAKAAAVAGEVANVLTGNATALAARYRSMFTVESERRLAGGAVCVDERCVVDPAMAPGMSPAS